MHTKTIAKCINGQVLNKLLEEEFTYRPNVYYLFAH